MFDSLNDDPPIWLITIAWMMILIFIFSISSYFFVFPFYLYVYKLNRTRDQRNVLFPTINHFFKMMQTVYIYSAISVICLILGYSLGLGLNASSEWSYYFSMFNLTIVWSLSIVIQVFYILIILLAIEKFTIYFFPSTEKFVILAQKYQIKHVRYMYLVIFIVQSILTLNAFGVRFWNINEIKIRSIIYISFNIIFILSALLYVPIMISVRKFSNLPSVQQNKPQLYIFWQTINILIFKFTFIAAYIACLFAQQAFEELVVLMMFLDIVIIPQIVQISYISCNKRNMDTLLKSFSCIKFTRIVFNRQETTSIAPQMGLETQL